MEGQVFNDKSPKQNVDFETAISLNFILFYFFREAHFQRSINYSDYFYNLKGITANKLYVCLFSIPGRARWVQFSDTAWWILGVNYLYSKINVPFQGGWQIFDTHTIILSCTFSLRKWFHQWLQGFICIAQRQLRSELPISSEHCTWIPMYSATTCYTELTLASSHSLNETPQKKRKRSHEQSTWQYHYGRYSTATWTNLYLHYWGKEVVAQTSLWIDSIFLWLLLEVLKYEILHLELSEIFSCLAMKCTSISVLFSRKIRWK